MTLLKKILVILFVGLNSLNHSGEVLSKFKYRFPLSGKFGNYKVNKYSKVRLLIFNNM